MTAAVTVLGLVQGGHLLPDIRTVVPHRTAIQIPGHLAERSQDLVMAIQQQWVMKLGVASAGSGKEAPPSLNPALRGRGIAPHHARPGALKADLPMGGWPREREALLTELELSRQQCQHQSSVNQRLQDTLAGLTAQLAEIQRSIDALARRRDVGSVIAPVTLVDDSVPQFIPSTSLDAAEVCINVTERASTSNVDEARAALRSLRGRPA